MRCASKWACLAVVLLAETAVLGAQSAQVPAAYADLYIELSNRLDDFEQRVDAEWDGFPRPVLFSAEFFPANANRDSQLIESLYPGFQLALNRFTDLGLEAVTFNLSYPMLHPDYHASAEERQAYLRLYRRLAYDVRARGLKLIVKSHAMLPWDNPAVRDFYARIRSYDEYRRGRMDVVYTIASELRPDFLSVQSEPDTEALVTGQPVGSPEGSLDLVRGLVAAARLGGMSTGVGAGIGTWQGDYQSYVANLLTRSGVDYIDLHVYPVGTPFLDRILDISDQAQAAGKRVAVSDAWLFKARQEELPYAPLMFRTIAARDPFSFWAPLDQRFLGVMVKLAHARRFLFLSPFWSNYFFSYLDYSLFGDLSTDQLLALSQAAAVGAVRDGDTTGTGVVYRRMIRW